MKGATFTAIVTGPVVAWHAYLWHRLFRATGLSPRLSRAGGAVLALLALAVLVTVARPRGLGRELTAIVLAISFPWIGFGLLLAIALAALDLARVAHQRARRDLPDEARRRTLSRVLGGVAMAAGGGATLAGASQALALTLQRVRVPLARLPASLSGLRVVQISDLHLGTAIGEGYLERVIAEVNALSPDLIAITGDLVDGSVAHLGPAVTRLRELHAKHGVFFVTGNHEYYSDAAAWCDHLASIGVRVLHNERVSIGGPEGSFDLAGVHDHGADVWGVGHRHDLPAALAGRDPSRELVLLAHQPVTVREAAQQGVGLQLSGHTHGGQIWPLRFVLYLRQPFVDGLHRVQDTWIYVSRGTGYWGPPMRLGAPPEITEITLIAG